MQEMNQIPERWYSTKEMCAYLGVTRDTLLTWINEKGMPAHKVAVAGSISPARLTSGLRVERQLNNIWVKQLLISSVNLFQYRAIQPLTALFLQLLALFHL